MQIRFRFVLHIGTVHYYLLVVLLKIKLRWHFDFQLWGFRGYSYPIRHPNDTSPFLYNVMCPGYLYNGDTYPTYLSGAGWGG